MFVLPYPASEDHKQCVFTNTVLIYLRIKRSSSATVETQARAIVNLPRSILQFFFSIVTGLSGIAVYAILLWTTSLEWVQASQFFYGLYIATEVAYYTYIYAKVSYLYAAANAFADR